MDANDWPPPRTCGSCRYWKPLENKANPDPDLSVGECRQQQPRALLVDDLGQVDHRVWPQTMGHDWCGGWRCAPELEPRELSGAGDLKLIDELLCDLKDSGGMIRGAGDADASWADVEAHTSITRAAMDRLFEAWRSGEMPVITLSLGKYLRRTRKGRTGPSDPV